MRRLVMVSAGISRDSFYPDMLAQQAMVGAEMAEAMRGTPMYDGYMATAPVPEDFPRLLDAMGGGGWGPIVTSTTAGSISEARTPDILTGSLFAISWAFSSRSSRISAA